jgi:catechol 2,3-dioxygenase-like lactoylglutathione lyase family enzyme
MSPRKDQCVPLAPPPRVYETILYAEDVQAAAAFYRDVLGLRLIDGPDEIGAGFRLSSGAVLLIFDPRRTSAAGRPAPSHGARGTGHIAFHVDASQLSLWRARFQELGLEIEKDRMSDLGGRQLYVRDPAGNSVELVEGEIWPDPPPAELA